MQRAAKAAIKCAAVQSPQPTLTGGKVEPSSLFASDLLESSDFRSVFAMYTMNRQMSASSGRVLWLILWLILAIGAGVGIVFFFGLRQLPPPQIAGATQPAPTTVAATVPATVSTLQTYGQVLHADFAHYPETRPWPIPVDLTDAAHLIFRESIYICSRGDLWITRSDADALPAVLARGSGESEHIVNRQFAYIIWALDRHGIWQPSAICRKASGFEIVSATATQAIPWDRSYRWDLAMTWDDGGTTRLIVPTNEGVSIITLGAQLTEDFCPLIDPGTTTRPSAAPAVLFDTRGLLAWIPADANFSGTRVARYLNGQWTTLDAKNWPGDVVYLVPLLDGSVLQIRSETDANPLTFVSLDNPDISPKDISALVDQLGDDDPQKRIAAYQQLSQYGPKVNPILQQLISGAAPEAQSRIRQLLQGTTLGGMAIIGNQLTVKARLRDGGMVFLAPQGVSIPQEGQAPDVVSPDYVAVRPGRAVQELPAVVVAALSKSDASVAAFGDEWIVTTPDGGPSRFLPPDQLDPLLRPGERGFSRMLGIDSRGRWLFRDDSNGRTLALDPTVPDPMPRLAIWSIDTGSMAGWNKADWPAIGRGDSHWIIDDHDWKPMDAGEAISTEAPALVEPSIAATSPTTSPDTTAQNGPLLMIDSAGNRYYDGQTTLTLVTAAGKRRVWFLPDRCAGSPDRPAHLVADLEGHLFLFNAAGEIARIRATPNDAQPFVLEAVFCDHIPDYESIQRIWRDPAGRIVVAYEGSHLSVIFPNGQIPREIADKILPQDLQRIDPH
jgi:hypothetical protein